MVAPTLLSGDDWEAGLLLNDNDWPRPCLANVVLILTCHPAWSDVIAYDESRGEVVQAQPGPSAELSDDEDWRPRSWGMADDTAAAVWLERAKLGRINPDLVARAVGLIASRQRINPVTTYLAGLRWDGVPRLARWLITYAGAPDSPYVQAVGAAWLRAAVARAFEPGCKADTALVLEGGQGKGKSTLLAILGGDHFTDDVADLHSKDAAQQVRRAWICELPEMAAGKRSEVEAQKAFVARQVDRVRPAYGRYVVEEKRRCVFAGTTNAQGYLQDATGNRRWWPVPCGDIDLAALRQDRDQVWAEAVHTYKAGAGWSLDPSLYGAAAEEQEARHLGDVWEDDCRSWLGGQESTSIAELLAHIGIERERRGRSEQMRAAGILQRLRWHRRQVRVVGGEREWRYFPPAPDPAPTPPAPTGGTNGVGDNETTGNVRPSPSTPTSDPSDESGTASSKPNQSDLLLGDLGDLGDKKVNQGGEASPTPGTNPPDSSVTAWWRRYQSYRTVLDPTEVPDEAHRIALQETTDDLGPCPGGAP